MDDGGKMSAPSPIQPLPDTVRAQLKSSVEITTLSDVVELLFQNSLDANANDIRIQVDFKTGFCAVTDNGCGIPASEFRPGGNLAHPYCTSKIKHDTCYGYNGQSLANIAALALVSITSRVPGGDAGRLLLQKSSRVYTGYSEELPRHIQTSGTSVVVQNLFGSLPVRRKSQALLVDDPVKLQRQFQLLKSRLIAHILAYQKPVNLQLLVKSTALSYTHKATSPLNVPSTFNAKTIHNIMRQAGLVSPVDAGCWKVASARANGLTIRAAVCLEPRPTKEAQFISLADQPLQRSGLGAVLFDTVNDLFDGSTFGTVKQKPGEQRSTVRSNAAYTLRSLRSAQIKGADRWPCFYVRIDASSNMLNESLSSRNEAEDQAGQGLPQITALLSMLIEEILHSQHFKLRARQSKSGHGRTSTGLSHTPTTSDSFGNWSRVRVAFPGHAEDLRHGLPFLSGKCLPEKELFPDADVELLLKDLEQDQYSELATAPPQPDSNVSVDQGILSPRQTATPDHTVATLDGDVIWTNPQTGKTVRLNSNSFAIPYEASQCQPSGTDEDGCGLLYTKRQRLPKSSVSLADVSERLRRWPAGTFKAPTELVIPSVATDFDREHSTARGVLPVREEILSVKDLQRAEVIQQVDQKFILTRVADKLVLIDQHAADERIKVEALFKELCDAKATPLKRPILIECTEDEAARFDQAQAYFASWAIRFVRSELTSNAIKVTHLPSMIAERCRHEPRILIDMMRKEVWNAHRHIVTDGDGRVASWMDRMVHCPADLLEMTNSRACRSAIMFNDVLTHGQCHSLVQSLAQCTLPFQCAHGRPSLAVLANLEFCGVGNALDDTDFGRAFRDWL